MILPSHLPRWHWSPSHSSDPYMSALILRLCCPWFLFLAIHVYYSLSWLKMTTVTLGPTLLSGITEHCLDCHSASPFVAHVFPNKIPEPVFNPLWGWTLLALIKEPWSSRYPSSNQVLLYRESPELETLGCFGTFWFSDMETGLR